MNGLLFGDDPRAAAATMGLLGMGSALLTPVNQGGGFGGAGRAAQQALLFQQQMQRQQQHDAMQREMFGMQRQQFELEQQAAQARQAALAQVGDEIARTRPDMLPAFRVDPVGTVKQLYGAQAPIKLGEGDRLYDPRTFQQVAENPKSPEQTELEKAIAARDKHPVGSPNWVLHNRKVEKLVTHAPAAQQTVYTGTLVPAEINGRPGFVMPGKDGTAVQVPGIAPPGTARATETAEARRQGAIQQANIVLGAIREAKDMVGHTTAGIGGAILGKVPGTSATDLQAKIDTIVANLGFDKLQAMRDASPTGGALGQVALQELAMLQSTVASLRREQSPDALRAGLEKAERHYMNWLKTLDPNAKAPTQQQSIDDLLKKYGN